MSGSLTIDDLRHALSDGATGSERGFAIAKGIATTLNRGEERDGRELVIRALDRRELFDKIPGLLDSLARHVGLYPYATGTSLSVQDQLALEYHRPEALVLRGQDVVFHREQSEVYQDLVAGQSVVLSAPTSFGKSIIIDALIAVGRYDTIVIIVPTIALIDETRRRLARFRPTYKIITHSSQVRENRSIFVLTQERVIDRVDIDEVDLLIIDEFYKLDGASGDLQRSMTLNHAFYKLSQKSSQLYFLGPSINEIPEGFGSRFNCVFRRTDYNTVVSQIHKIDWRPNRGNALVNLCKTLDEPTLIYCKSPNQAHDVARILLDAEIGTSQPALEAAASWVGREYHPDWSYVAALRRGIGLHHGSIPRALSQLNVAMFNERALRFLVCTSTLIEGVNTAAKNVVVYENKIAVNKLDFFTFNNIRGRSGRMFEHYVGNVYIFDEAPEEKFGVVDIPVFTQGDSAALGLLLQVDQADLTQRSVERLRYINAQSELSVETLRRNASVGPDDQIRLATSIRQNLRDWLPQLRWSGYPSSEQLKFICGLIFDYLIKKHYDGIASGPQLAFRIQQLRLSASTQALISTILQNDTAAKGEPDRAVRIALDFQRKWAMFHFPRLLMAVDSIQREVLTRAGGPAGSYGKYASDVESLFLPAELVGLDEYGLPIQLGLKLRSHLHLGDGMDSAIASLRRLNVLRLSLSMFERKLIERVQEGL
jgi:hypothetical protein